VRIWNLQTGQAKVLRGPRDHVRALTFSPDGGWIATGSDDHCVHIWSLRDGGYSVLRGMSGPVRSVVFTRDGKSVIAAGDDGTVRQWNITALDPAPLRSDALERWLQARTTAVIPEPGILDL